MNDMRERVGDEELLRIVRAVDVPGPETDVAARTRPEAALKSQRHHHADKDTEHDKPWQQFSQRHDSTVV